MGNQQSDHTMTMAATAATAATDASSSSSSSSPSSSSSSSHPSSAHAVPTSSSLAPLHVCSGDCGCAGGVPVPLVTPSSLSSSSSLLPSTPAASRAARLLGHVTPRVAPLTLIPPTPTAAYAYSVAHTTASAPSTPAWSFPPRCVPGASNLIIRPLRIDDYAKGFPAILSQLSDVGKVTQEMFEARFRLMASRGYTYTTIVIEDTSLLSPDPAAPFTPSLSAPTGAATPAGGISRRMGRIIAAATLLIEDKFLHGCSRIGHVEDVVVLSGYRGKNLGLKVVDSLHEIAKHHECYKIILDCTEKNMSFYAKLGYQENQRHMALYFKDEKKKEPLATKAPTPMAMPAATSAAATSATPSAFAAAAAPSVAAASAPCTASATAH